MMMKRVLAALLVAPAPVFLFLSVFLVEPRFGLSDALASIAIAFALSYGFMWVTAPPITIVLERFGWRSWACYLSALLLAVVLSVAVLTFLEEAVPHPDPTNHSPLAALTLRDGGWVIALALWSPLVAIMTALFWSRVTTAEAEAY
ncbi:hypothetical protein [Sphingomonas lenta]|uniref:Uncharacterized protein n=1 Tax=Sphingomonas lenta TaxID=1141887 RepID=A0A2A2SFJ0_9SPHN|nr:hypothetical protein [Sphingomonas lenta]PAX07781.1 hypothetical protein CKY28_09110 [Sphingomonas lenta]